MADTTPKSYSADPTLYLYTSLTAGSSHITTATSRLETILKANKIPFKALDVATDEKARMLWGRRSKGKKLPGLVKYGNIVGDLEEIEEWNEYGELKQQIASTDVAAPTQKVSATNTPSKLPTAHGSVVAAAPKASPDLPSTSPLSKGMGEESDALRMTPSRKEETPLTMAMRQAGAEAAKKADEKKGSRLTAPISGKGLKAIEVSTPAVATKMPKSVEEPGSSTETEVPGNLTEEGTKRNSMDQIVGADGSSEQEHIGSFEEATMPEARRAGNTAKTQSPFSGTATTSSREHEATSLESSPRAPRGSSVSMGTKENIEKENAISEETEDAGPRSIKTSTQDTEEPPTSRPGTAEKPEDSADATTSDVTATDEGEAAATKGNKPQGQNAKDPEAASASVGD